MLHDPKWKLKHDAKQVLLDAAQYIEAHGWCQGAMKSGHRVCLFGAIREVNRCTYIEVEFEIVNMLRKAIGDDRDGLNDGSGTVASWNDAPLRTKQEVIDILRSAANA